MSPIDNEKLRAAAVMSDPFEYFVVPGSNPGDALRQCCATFLNSIDPAAFLSIALNYGPVFRELA